MKEVTLTDIQLAKMWVKEEFDHADFEYRKAVYGGQEDLADVWEDTIHVCFTIFNCLEQTAKELEDQHVFEHG